MTKYSHEENSIAVAATFKMQVQQDIEKVVEEQFQDICGVEVIYEEQSDEEEKKFRLKIWCCLPFSI